MSADDQIRRTFAEFCQHLDNRHFEDWANLFTEDGVFNTLSGRAAILAMISGAELASDPELSRKHVITNSIIEVDGDGEGDVAHARSDLLMYDRHGDGPWTLRIGTYVDRLVRQGDRWLLADRQLSFPLTSMPSTPAVRIPLANLIRRLDNDAPDYLTGSPGLYLCLALAYDSLAAPANILGADGVSSPDFSRMQSRLATAWNHTSPTSWEVALRPGVRSHAGNELTSADIAWAFRKNFATPVMAAWRWRDSAGIDGPEGVIPVDPHLLRYQVRVANPNFPAYLQWLTPNIVDSTEILRFATPTDPWGIAWLDDNVAGFGAYDLASFDEDQAEFTARGDYWDGEPEVGRVKLHPVGTRTEALAELDGPGPVVVLGLDADETREALTRGDVDVQRTWAGHVRVQLDFRVAPFGDRRVRQALAFATPYQAIIDDAFAGLARPWRSPVKGISPWYTDRHWTYDTNLETARGLLKEAGLGQGFSTDLHFDHRPDCDRVALLLQEAWRQVGVEVNLHHLPRTGTGPLPMVLTTDCGHNLSEPLYDLVHDFASIPMLFPEKSPDFGVGKWNPHLIRQEEIIDALRQALTQTDEEVLHHQVDDLQRRILEEACTIHLAEKQQTMVAKNVPKSFYAPDSRFFHAMQYQNARCDTYLPWWEGYR